MSTETFIDRINDNSGIAKNWSSSSPEALQINKALLGLLIFIGTEVMFFGGLISSFLILRSGITTWPPLNQPRLPVEITGINTFILLLSGFAMARAVRSIQSGNVSGLVKRLSAASLLGAIFLIVQGYEWIRLVSYGLTFTSSIYGATFYALIGCHALHVIGAMVALLRVLRNATAKMYTSAEHRGVVLCAVYWYFVVAIWPLLYILVYLS